MTASRILVNGQVRDIYPQDLAAYLFRKDQSQTITVIPPSGIVYCGVVNQIQREDGSGKNYNLIFADGSTLFVRTR